MENFNLETALKQLSNTEISDSERVSLFIEISNYYVDIDFGESMKYASFATVSTKIPRADACCCIGDRYLLIGEYEWARKWYNNAISNVSHDIDAMYYGWLPSQKIAQTYLIEGNYTDALKFVETSLILNPKDEECINLKKFIINKINNTFSAQ